MKINVSIFAFEKYLIGKVYDAMNFRAIEIDIVIHAKNLLLAIFSFYRLKFFSFRLKLRGTNVLLKYLARTSTAIPNLYERDAFETGQVNIFSFFK